MLSEGLQNQLETLLTYLNDTYEKLRERAERPNFEIVYDHIIELPENPSVKLVAELHWHEELYVANLNIVYSHVERRFAFQETWVPTPVADLATVAESRSAAIRWAQEEIKGHETKFIKQYGRYRPEGTDA